MELVELRFDTAGDCGGFYLAADMAIGALELIDGIKLPPERAEQLLWELGKVSLMFGWELRLEHPDQIEDGLRELWVGVALIPTNNPEAPEPGSDEAVDYDPGEFVLDQLWMTAKRLKQWAETANAWTFQQAANWLSQFGSGITAYGGIVNMTIKVKHLLWLRNHHSYLIDQEDRQNYAPRFADFLAVLEPEDLVEIYIVCDPTRPDQRIAIEGAIAERERIDELIRRADAPPDEIGPYASIGKLIRAWWD